MKFVLVLALLVAFIALSSAEGQVQDKAHQEKREQVSSTVTPAQQSTTNSASSPANPTTVSPKTVEGVPKPAHSENTNTGRANIPTDLKSNDSVNLKSFSLIALASLALFTSRLF